MGGDGGGAWWIVYMGGDGGAAWWIVIICRAHLIKSLIHVFYQ